MQDIFCHINCQQEFLIDNDSKNKEIRKHWFVCIYIYIYIQPKE